MHHDDHELTTARTTMTPFADGDLGELLELFSEPAVRGPLLDGHDVAPSWVQRTIDDSERRFARSGAGLWGVRLTGSPRLIGFGGFREFTAPPEQQLLYGFLPAVWGRGLAGEVTARLCGHAFERLGFDEVTATTDADNRGSIRVLERLGMRLYGADEDAEGAVTLHYAVSRRGWIERQRRQDA